MKRAIILIILLIMGVYTMSLWDKDKATDNRGIPTPQSKDENKARMAHGTTAFTLKQEDTDSELGKLVFKDGKLSLIKPDGAVVNITGDGMKVAQPGFDANTTSDANLVLTSDLNSFKIAKKGTYSYTGLASISNNTTDTITIPHGLGTTPVALVYVNAVAVVTLQGGKGITTLPVDYVLPGASQSNTIFTLQARVDSTNLYLDFICHAGTANNFSTYTWPYTYYLLVETAN